MARLRTVEGLTLGEIAARYGIGAERVRQLVNRHIYLTTGRLDAKAISEVAAQIRREKDTIAALALTDAILAAWCAGGKPESIARRLGLRKRSVKQVIDSALLVGGQDRRGVVGAAHVGSARECVQAKASLPGRPRKGHMHIDQQDIGVWLQQWLVATLQEIAEHFGISQATARRITDGLVAQGKLTVEAGRPGARGYPRRYEINIDGGDV